MLEELGVCPDDKVTVHSALRQVGPMENGADGLIDALCKYLSDGLLLIPTHTWEGISIRKAYDVRTEPTCLGALSKVALERKEGIRSMHPTHSVTVFGKDAKNYIRGEEDLTQSPCPVGSCLSRLYEEEGKIILLGCGMNNNTYLHAVEERLQVPGRLSEDTMVIRMTDYEGNTFDSKPFHHYCAVGPQGGASECFENYEKPLAACGALTYSRLGNACVICCDARKTVEILKVLWKNAEYDLCVGVREIPESYYAQLLAGE